MAFQWDVAIGEHLTRDQRVERFGGSRQGGMEPSAKTPNMFIYSDPSRGAVHGYTFDGWAPDGCVFLYTGEGPRGDQLMRDGDKALLDHKSNGQAVRLFVADGFVTRRTKNHLYLGEFGLDAAQPYTIEDAPDADGELRTVFVFRLKPVAETIHRDEDASKSEADITMGSAQLVDLETDRTTVFETPGAPPTTATKREAELVQRFTAMLTGKGHSVRRWKLRAPGELTSMLTDIFDESGARALRGQGLNQQTFDPSRLGPTAGLLTAPAKAGKETDRPRPEPSCR